MRALALTCLLTLCAMSATAQEVVLPVPEGTVIQVLNNERIKIKDAVVKNVNHTFIRNQWCYMNSRGAKITVLASTSEDTAVLYETAFDIMDEYCPRRVMGTIATTRARELLDAHKKHTQTEEERLFKSLMQK